MLIASRRHTRADIEAWRHTEAKGRAWAATAVHRKRVEKSRAAVLSFTGGGPCYAGVSWGKDSVCLAHLVATLVPRIPLVWVRVEPDYNPDCPLVRDAFLARHQVRYDEIEIVRGEPGRAHGTLVAGAAIAAQRHGARYMSGIRAEESKSRERRAMMGDTAKTSAPIAWWHGIDVLAYLVTRDLPIHPAYACTMGGLLDSMRDVRVSPLGGARGDRPGDGTGRAEWERRYYGVELTALGAAKNATTTRT